MTARHTATDPAEGTIGGTEVDLAPIRERFGGIDTPAALMGMFAAIGVLVFLGALVGAGAAGIAYELNAIDLDGTVRELAAPGVVVAVVIVFVSFLLGGWATGRMARYDGGVNGIGVALWMLFLIAAFAAAGVFFGSEYNAFQQAGLPNWFAQIRGDGVTAIAIVAAAAGIAAMFGGGYLGGRLGEQFHLKADAAIASQQRVASRYAELNEEHS